MDSFAKEVLQYIHSHTKEQLEETVKRSLEIQSVCTEKQHNLKEINEQVAQKSAEAESGKQAFATRE